MNFKDSENEKVLYKKEEQVIYDEYDEGYILNWLVSKSNEYDMEPLILTLKPGASYKILIHQSLIRLFIVCQVR